MEGISREKLSTLLSEKLSKDIEIIEIVPAGSGFHSSGFKLLSKTGEAFFLKKIKSGGAGFEFPERKLASLLVSDSMGKRQEGHPQPIGVIVSTGEKEGFIPSITHETDIYHIQEFEDAGISYWNKLNERRTKQEIDETDRTEIASIISYIAKVHAIRHPLTDPEELKLIYNDSLRSSLTHPETTLSFLHKLGADHPFLPLERQKMYMGLMWDIIHTRKDRFDRLTALHGDFWGGNLFFKADGSVWVIDYSRMPWGDPAVDVGHWMSQYLRIYHETENEYFKNLGEYFIQEYIRVTGDNEIRNHLALELGTMGSIYLSFTPHPSEQVEQSFLDAIIESMRTNTFVWKK